MGSDIENMEKGDEDADMPNLMELPCLPKSLSFSEKKYLLAVERGDLANVRRMLQSSHRYPDLHVNCVDSFGRGALTLAIDAEHMEMVELLVVMGVETRDSLLHAINAEFVEAVELLLEHEELIYKEGEPYSWQKVDPDTAMFTSDITPLVLAAHRNNYEIIKMLLDRGATLPMPHDIKCGCDDCIHDSIEDSLRLSMSRVNQYRALASSSLMALSSSDPILTAFELSWELRNMAFAEQESKSEYLELRKQCQAFAVSLLDQSRSSQELAIILNYDPDAPPYERGEHMKLARLELAINFKQKKFVAHPNIQQLLASIWYEGVPGFRRKTTFEKLFICIRVAMLFPFYCTLFIIAPDCKTGKLMRKPFMKFLIHASSYLFFLLILILVSQRAEVQLIQLFGTDSMKKTLEEELLKQRGNRPTYLEHLLVVYVIGFIWEETQEMFVEGMRSYLRNMWNFIDFTRNSLYMGVMLLRSAAYLQQYNEIKKDPATKFIAREHWDDFDPQLIAEGLFAAANIFSALKLVHLFSINPHLGPLQISLGRMVIDIVKFFFIYSLVLFAFACGLNQLLWYFAELEKKKCYVLSGGRPDWENASDSCMKWRSFGNVFEASQSLFWASFGMVGLENFELEGIKSYTRFWGLLMFGSYSMINVIVLLNLLIAMMSNSYAMITEHSDVEWKFARTRLWMSYFEESSTLPPPFNIFPTPKWFLKLFGIRKKDKLRRIESKKKKERDVRYTAVMRAIVWRYVSAMHRKADDEPVTEDDVNEIKGDISSMRYEMLEVFERNGMDVSFTDRKEKAVLGRRMKMWERRLMKDFQLAPTNLEEETIPEEEKIEDENSLARFRRVAELIVANTSVSKWDQLLQGVCTSSQIGRCRSQDTFKSRQKLQQAIDAARKLTLSSPGNEILRTSSPVMPASPGRSLMELIKDMANDTDVSYPAESKLTAAATGGSEESLPQFSRFPDSLVTNNFPLLAEQTFCDGQNSSLGDPSSLEAKQLTEESHQKATNPSKAPCSPPATEPDVTVSRLKAAKPTDGPTKSLRPPPLIKNKESSPTPSRTPLFVTPVVPSVEVTPVTPKRCRASIPLSPLTSHPSTPTTDAMPAPNTTPALDPRPALIMSTSPRRGRSSPVPPKPSGFAPSSPARNQTSKKEVTSSLEPRLTSTSSTDCLLPPSPRQPKVVKIKQLKTGWL